LWKNIHGMTNQQVIVDNHIFWFTGLSGAGKTTLCRELVAHLRKQGRQVVMLDGDDLREVMGATTAHSRNERLKLAMRYAHLCHMIAVQGFDVAIATISMFREVHEWNRNNLPGYIEIFLDVPMKELERRDPKNIYARASKGDLENVAGVDFEVDKPRAPDVLLAWQEGGSLESTFNILLHKLKLLGLKNEN
jgi:cytidine diphosphoramidate kinase